MVTNAIGKLARKHEKRLLHHVNVEAIQLPDNSELVNGKVSRNRRGCGPEGGYRYSSTLP